MWEKICECCGVKFSTPSRYEEHVAARRESQEQPLLEPVARAICIAAGANPDQPVYRNGNAESGVLYYKWKLYRKEADAAIAACHAEQALSALRLLVDAKDMKDRGDGFSEAYMAKRTEGWAKARALLAKLGGKS